MTIYRTPQLIDLDTLRHRLIEMIKDRKLTVAQVMQLTKVSNVSIIRFLNGRNITMKVAFKIDEALQQYEAEKE